MGTPRKNEAKMHGRRVERQLHNAERREEAMAVNDLMHGNVAGFMRHEAQANQIHRVEHQVHHQNVLHHKEQRQHNMAVNDLMHGNIGGAIAHEQHAQNLHHRQQHHGHHGHHRW